MRRRRDGGFEQFYRSTKDDLVRALIVAVRDRALAEDALSEAYARALRRWDDVAEHPYPSGWVMRTALNYARSEGRIRACTSSDDVPEVPVSDDPPTDPELLRRILALPERQQDVVALRVVLDFDTSQTAQVLGIAEGTVTTHLFRALSRLEQEVASVAPKEAWT
jgi:RNA polymerase sigma factor (sigma-70 family)